MKIKNDLISIKIGKKQYDFHNLILNTYLNKFAYNQLNVEETYNKISAGKELRYLLIKFDIPFEDINENSVVRNDEFDILVPMNVTEEQEINEIQITTKYIYNISDILKFGVSRRRPARKYKRIYW